jgi:hypothetical protein
MIFCQIKKKNVKLIKEKSNILVYCQVHFYQLKKKIVKCKKINYQIK